MFQTSVELFFWPSTEIQSSTDASAKKYSGQPCCNVGVSSCVKCLAAEPKRGTPSVPSRTLLLQGSPVAPANSLLYFDEIVSLHLYNIFRDFVGCVKWHSYEDTLTTVFVLREQYSSPFS